MSSKFGNKPLELWFFYGKNCSICHDLWPKVQALMTTKYPEVELKHLAVEEHRELAAQERLLSVPGLIFWVHGREHFRANGFLYLKQLEDKVDPAYSAYYQ